jgi:hypothetical protein
MSANADDSSGKQSRALTVVPSADKAEIAAAAHAYEATGHVADPPVRHRIDVEIGEPRKPPRRSLFGRMQAAPAAHGDTVHRLANPTRTGFAVGFGAAAGAFVFRAIVALIGVAVLVALAVAALSYLEP